MQKQAPTVPRLLVMVVFALSCFGLLLFLWVSFGGTIPLQAKGYRVNVDVGEATQLAKEADVRISGVRVGKVKTLAEAGNLTKATLQIEPKYAPLPRDTHAILRQKTLLGETFMELTPGHRSSGTIPDNGTLPKNQVQQTVELDEILRSLDAKSRRDLQSFVQGFAGAVKGRGPDLNNALGALSGTVDDGGQLLEQAAADRRAVASVLHDGGTVLGTIGARDQATRDIITSGDRVFRTTAAQSADLRRTLRALPPALRSLRDTTPSVAPLAAELTPTLRALQPVARVLQPTLHRAGLLGDQLTATSNDLAPIIPLAAKGLPATRQILRAAGPLLDRVSPLAADLAPVATFLDAYKNDFPRSWAQVAAATNVTAATASGRQAHYLRLTLPLGEILAQSAKRSPQSRANPYPRPGGLEDISKLEALSCTHTSNPENGYVATGKSPDCRTQPAYDIGGVKTTFPNLVPAAP